MSTNVNVEFVITGDIFDINTITEKLEIQPTEQWIKGEKVPNRKVVRKDTCWSYGLGEEDSLDIYNQLSKIINILNPRRDVLRGLKETFELEYLFLVTINIENDVKPIISLKSPIIELMDDIGAEFDVDLYLF